MTPRGAILEATRAALAAIASLPKIYESFAEVVQAADERSIVVGPGQEEEILGEVHGGGSTRKYPVRVICTAWSREGADQIASEVEAAIGYGALDDRIGARIASVNFTDTSDKSERIYFSTIVNLEVLYEAAAPA